MSDYSLHLFAATGGKKGCGVDGPYGIDLTDIDFSYGANRVLRKIELRVPRGGVCGLLGPSGCGKTTLVKVAAGILRAEGGSAKVLGGDMPNLRLMERIGYMAQSDALYLSLTAAENIAFFGSVYGMRGREIKRRAARVMETVGLGDELRKPVHMFSGGMKRRLSLALALLHEPAALILDEPTVGIDPLLRRDIWRDLQALAATGVTILVTTHVMDEADKCEQLALMRDGEVIACGALPDILAMAGTADIEEAFIRLSAAEKGGET
jgi:ABC-2 type transport system ATP-binding protein